MLRIHETDNKEILTQITPSFLELLRPNKRPSTKRASLAQQHSMNSGLKVLNLMAQFQRLPVPGTSTTSSRHFPRSGWIRGLQVAVPRFPFLSFLFQFGQPCSTPDDYSISRASCGFFLKHHSVDLIFVYDDDFDRRLSPPSLASGICKSRGRRLKGRWLVATALDKAPNDTTPTRTR